MSMDTNKQADELKNQTISQAASSLEQSKQKPQKGKGSIFARLKAVKHIEWIIAGILVAVLMLVYAGVSSALKNADDKDTVVTTAYEDKLIDSLEGVLSQIKGAGKVKVMVSFAGSKSYEYAQESDKKVVTESDSGGGSYTTSTESSAPVIVSNGGKSELLITKENMPDILGVIIVAEGAEDATVRFSLRQAVMTAINVGSNKINIFTMK